VGGKLPKYVAKIQKTFRLKVKGDSKPMRGGKGVKRGMRAEQKKKTRRNGCRRNHWGRKAWKRKKKKNFGDGGIMG